MTLAKNKFWEVPFETQFNKIAVSTFNYQYNNNLIYKSYCDLIKIDPNKIKTINEIPFLPIEFFKTKKVKSFKGKENKIFYSSSTNKKNRSKHYIKSISNYIQSFRKCFNLFYGDIENYNLLALLPSYLEREDSSLIFMVHDLINLTRSSNSGFFINDYKNLYSKLDYLDRKNKKTILFGVSFALLDFIETKKINLKNTIIMETGGMKGRRKEIIRKELHEKLKKGFNVSKIHSEYGMTELLSQAYSKGNGIFTCPPWMKVSIRKINDPLSNFINQESGPMNIIDLANYESCSFIATQDLGKILSKNKFEVIGRIDESDTRGCNLMIF
ncbi:MAG: acyl transferase [Flavobacteriaceae bacterium]|nr:acyl transferase [Flavobacteriaceae bacterium]